MKNKFFISLTLFGFYFFNVFSQVTINDLNVFFHHNFESNTPGSYEYSVWQEDWNYPDWSNRQEYLVVSQDNSDNTNTTNTLLLDFPQSSLGPSEGGTQWWTPLEQHLEEAYFSYDIKFMPGFEFQHGGKIPGLKSGNIGFSRPTGYDGFEHLMMFKGDRPAFYLYYPDNYLDEYGATFMWGGDQDANYLANIEKTHIVIDYCTPQAQHFSPGSWDNITFRVVLNSVGNTGGNYDGILEAFFNGKLVLQISHILYRHTTSLKIDRINITSFFGGNSDIWRNPIHEWLKLDNFALYSYPTSDNSVPHGNNLSPIDRTINYLVFRTTNSFSVPIVSTAPVTNITQSTATGGGTIASNGGSEIAEKGICWSLIANPTIADNKITDITGNSTFSSNIDGLNPGTTYHVRAYATNSAGLTGYGEELTFNTLLNANSLLTNLTTYYKLDETSGVLAEDFVGNNDGTLANGILHSSGKVNNACEFDGINDKITYGTSLTSGLSEVTISMWVYPHVLSTTNTLIDEVSGDYWQYNITQGVWRTRDASTGSTGSRNNDLNLPALSVNAWNHLVFVYSVSGGYKRIYLNGVQSANTTTSIDALTSIRDNLSNSIGGAVDGSYFDGKIDEVEIWSRALSANEVANLFSSINNGTVPIVQINSFSYYQTSASFESLVVSSGGSPMMFQGVCWNTSPNPTIENNKTSNMVVPIFISQIIDLSPGTNYYARAYATNSAGITGYSEEVTFTTLPNSLLNNLTSFYKLDETNGIIAEDFVGNNDGTLANGILHSSGKVNNACEFDGINDKITYGTSLTSGLSEVTISMWVYPHVLSTANTLIDEVSGEYWQYNITQGVWRTRDASTGSTGSRNNDLNLPALSVNAWNHLVFVYTVSGGYKRIYLNGVQSANTTTSIDALTSNRDNLSNSIGGAVDGSYFDGKMDEVGMWSRALTADEIMSIFTKGNSGISYPFNVLKSSKEVEQKKNVNTNSSICVFPNPFSDDITIKNLSGSGVIEIYTLLGQRIRYVIYSDIEQVINLSSLEAGYYIIKIQSLEGAIETFKLLKSN